MVSNSFHIKNQPWLQEFHSIAFNALQQGCLSVDYMVEAMGISERCLQRKLKQATGVTPKAFLTEIQMQEARKRLLSGKVTQVNELALSLGFKNAHYFSQKYENRFGKKPIDYISQ